MGKESLNLVIHGLSFEIKLRVRMISMCAVQKKERPRFH